MISFPANTRIWIVAGITDMRGGFTGLTALVQTKLEADPLSGHVFVFRGRRGDLIKVLWFDGDGLCLFAKRLDVGGGQCGPPSRCWRSEYAGGFAQLFCRAGLCSSRVAGTLRAW